MRKPLFLVILNCFLVLILISCQKEVENQFDNNGNGTGNGGGPGGGTGNTQGIIGDYNFVGIEGVTQSTITVSSFGQELKAVSDGGYISTNNVGTAKITSNQIIFAGMGYEIDTTIHVVSYVNGSVFDDTHEPYQTSVPPSNDTMTYTRVNADSITLTGGDIVPTGSVPITQGPIGARTSWSGDTLFLRVNQTINTSISQGGVPGQLQGKLSGVIKLKKR